LRRTLQGLVRYAAEKIRFSNKKSQYFIGGCSST
jgi:hypothetical protein